MILEILSLDESISFIDTTICSSRVLASAICEAASFIFSAARSAFSAFLPVMELISSLDAEVSSSDAACSEAPCASAWEDAEICEAAAALPSEAALSSSST